MNKDNRDMSGSFMAMSHIECAIHTIHHSLIRCRGLSNNSDICKHQHPVGKTTSHQVKRSYYQVCISSSLANGSRYILIVAALYSKEHNWEGNFPLTAKKQLLRNSQGYVSNGSGSINSWRDSSIFNVSDQI